MISRISYNIKKSKFGRNIRSEVNLRLLLFINRSITKKFLINRLLEIINSSVSSHGEFEYDKQNWLQHQITLVRRKIWSDGYLLLSLYINRSITKKFPIKTLLEMIDSTCPRFFTLESVLSVIVLIGNFFDMDRFQIS